MTTEDQPIPNPTENDLLTAVLNRLSSIEKRLDDQPKQATPVLAEPQGEIPGYNLESWFPEAFHSPGIIGGIVVDEGLARETPCSRIALGQGELVYSKGIVGALSKEEQILYCPTGTVETEVSADTRRRLEIMREATTICQQEVAGLSTGERLQPFMKCFAKVISEQGVKI